MSLCCVWGGRAGGCVGGCAGGRAGGWVGGLCVCVYVWLWRAELKKRQVCSSLVALLVWFVSACYRPCHCVRRRPNRGQAECTKPVMTWVATFWFSTPTDPVEWPIHLAKFREHWTGPSGSSSGQRRGSDVRGVAHHGMEKPRVARVQCCLHWCMKRLIPTCAFA